MHSITLNTEEIVAKINKGIYGGEKLLQVSGYATKCVYSLFWNFIKLSQPFQNDTVKFTEIYWALIFILCFEMFVCLTFWRKSLIFLLTYKHTNLYCPKQICILVKKMIISNGFLCGSWALTIYFDLDRTWDGIFFFGFIFAFWKTNIMSPW